MIRGIVYFCLVFGVGFALGTIRVLWVVPRLGERAAELLEAPLMLVATVLAAQFVTRRFPAARRLDHLVSGVIALVMMLTVEFTVVLGLRGLTISEYFTERDTIAGAVYVIMLLLFAVMPWLISRRHAMN